MTYTKIFSAIAIMGGALVSANAYAGYVTDAHGNVGYDTAAECDAAVQAGTAKFYQSFTSKPTLLRAGEASVKTARLSDLGPQYRLGACDMGVGKKLGRDGVASALQGKYVPYSPNMPVNVYFDKNGQPVRATMQKCDNWFSGNSPRPVAPKAVAAPVAAAPVVAAPVAAGLRPYVFGTVGALSDGASVDGVGNDRETRFAGQVGAGLQFNEWLGGELFYQGAARHKLYDDADNLYKVRNNTYGARLTAGTKIADKTRLFGKLGVAGVRHSTTDYKNTKARLDLGAGLTYDLTNNLALRADYDHYFKRKSDDVTWKGADYFGLGLQYNF